MACSSSSSSATDIIKEQTKELRGTQRQISRDRAALEKQEKQMVSEQKNGMCACKNKFPKLLFTIKLFTALHLSQV